MQNYKVKIGVVYSQIIPLGSSQEIFEDLYNLLAYDVQNSYYIKALSKNRYIQEQWDGQQHLFSKISGKFLTGHLPIVLDILDSSSISYEIEDFRPKYKIGEPLKLINLIERPYQKEAVEAILEHKRGRIWARPRSGKCIKFDSLLFTQKGMVTFEEFNEGKIYPFNITVFGKMGKINASHLCYCGQNKTIKIKTNNGFVLEGTPEHSILIFTKNLETKFKKLKDICKDDYIVIQRNQHYFGTIIRLPKFEYFNKRMVYDCIIPKFISKKFARFLAYIIAEGNINNGRITFTNIDKKLVFDFFKIVKQLFEIKNIKKYGIDYSIHNTKLQTFVEFLGIKRLSKNKRIPLCIRQAPKKIVKEFIRILFECEGSVGKNIEFSTASKIMAQQLHIILLNFGIVSKLFPHFNKKYHRNYYRIVIGGNNVQKFANTIGFISDRKRKKLSLLCEKVGKGNNYDKVPFIFPLIYSLRRKLVDCRGKCIPKIYGLKGLESLKWGKSLIALTKTRNFKKKDLKVTYIALRKILKMAEIKEKLRNTNEYKILSKISKDNLYFDKIIYKRKSKTKVFDFVIPKEHSFFANGFINHNTVLMAMLYGRLAIVPFIIICQSIDIAYQTKEKFERFLPQVPVGIVGDGKCDIKTDGVTIITIQSCAFAFGKKYIFRKGEKKELSPGTLEHHDKIKELIKSAKIVWVDEVHHAISEVYQIVLKNVRDAEYVVGASGTLYREDNTDLYVEGLVGSLIFEISYSDLIKGGYLVAPTIHMIRLPQNITPSNNSYSTIYKECIIENDTRNNIISRIVQNLTSRGKSSMVLVSKIKHGEILNRLIPGSIFLRGADVSDFRIEMFQNLRDKKLMCLITTLGDEGLDIESLDATIIASGGKSAIQAFQRLRCTTQYKNLETGEEKKSAIVIDFIDPYKFLKSHSNKRKRLYGAEKLFKIVIKDCSKR